MVQQVKGQGKRDRNWARVVASACPTMWRGSAMLPASAWILLTRIRLLQPAKQLESIWQESRKHHDRWSAKGRVDFPGHGRGVRDLRPSSSTQPYDVPYRPSWGDAAKHRNVPSENGRLRQMTSLVRVSSPSIPLHRRAQRYLHHASLTWPSAIQQYSPRFCLSLSLSLSVV